MSIFDHLREQVPIESALGTDGSSKVHCVAPGHRDDNPSMHLYDDHAHCFSCKFHGDVTDVWAAKQGLDRPIEAALDLAREFGIELPQMTPAARKKVQKRRKKENIYLKQARACHNALDQQLGVVEWWEGRGFGKELRERFLLGTNKSGTAAVIPFWNRGRVQGLIKRKLEGEPKYINPEGEKFPAGYRPLFVPGSVRGGDVFLVEGIVDALALAALGERVVAVGGTSISEPQMRELKQLRGILYILPDRDEDGGAAGNRWVRELYPQALLCPPKYGEEDEHAS